MQDLKKKNPHFHYFATISPRGPEFIGLFTGSPGSLLGEIFHQQLYCFHVMFSWHSKICADRKGWTFNFMTAWHIASLLINTDDFNLLIPINK